MGEEAAVAEEPIAGALVVRLERIPDERGTIMHMLKSTDEHFLQFGEIYFTTIYRDVGKGWHRHREMTLNYACVFGRIKLVLYDDREESPTKGALQEIFLGPDNHALVVIPPDVWNGDEGDERPLCDRRQLLYPSSRPVADDAARPIRQRHSVRLANPTPLTPGLAAGRIVVLESGSVHVRWGSPT
jgi:dTDP-4-dehydrorhamnose 3,5-epimerase